MAIKTELSASTHCKKENQIDMVFGYFNSNLFIGFEKGMKVAVTFINDGNKQFPDKNINGTVLGIFYGYLHVIVPYNMVDFPSHHYEYVVIDHIAEVEKEEKQEKDEEKQEWQQKSFWSDHPFQSRD